MRKERKEALESFLVRLGVTMQDLSLMDTALTHSSYAYECKEKVVPEFNQRLEFLGDSVLSLVVSTHLYLAYPEMDEGALSKFRGIPCLRRDLGGTGSRPCHWRLSPPWPRGMSHGWPLQSFHPGRCL